MERMQYAPPTMRPLKGIYGDTVKEFVAAHSETDPNLILLKNRTGVYMFSVFDEDGEQSESETCYLLYGEHDPQAVRNFVLPRLGELGKVNGYHAIGIEVGAAATPEQVRVDLESSLERLRAAC